MADYNSGLPVRSEADGADERVHVKVVDGLTPSQRMTVDTDLNAHVEMHANNPAGADVVVKASQSGNIALDGFYDVTNNSVPSSSAPIVISRVATPTVADQVIRQTGIIAAAGNVRAADVALFDESGIAFSDLNPLPVKISETEGTIVQNYKVATSIAAAASDNHDYTVTALKTLILTQIEASASGKAKMEVQIETGVATGTFNTFQVMFNSTAIPNMQLKFQDAKQVAAGVRVRLIMTNKDNQSQDLYSTIIGHEI